jgi:hypothetical protein
LNEAAYIHACTIFDKLLNAYCRIVTVEHPLLDCEHDVQIFRVLKMEQFQADQMRVGCQMVCFQTKNPYLGKFWSVLQWMMMVYVYYGHLVHFMYGLLLYFMEIW